MLKIEKISNSVTYIGALDPSLKTFDIVMETKFGTTYNSYLVNGGDEFALIETAKEEYFEEYFEKLNNLCDIKKIKYIVVNHTEPDHTGEIHNLLEKMPWLTIVGTPCALGFLKDISNKEFKTLEVKEGTILKVGDKTFSFRIAPNLHWPDSMFTYLEEENILFTCDVFGAHYSTQNVFNDQVENKENYQEAFKYYHDAIFGPFKPFVKDGLKKIENDKLNLICPSHGPVLRENLENYKKQYLEWANEIEINKNKISICFTSAYGFTKTIAEEIKKGIEKYHFEVSMIDLLEMNSDRAVQEILSSQSFLIGSPTINADTVPPIWDLLLKLSPKTCESKLAGAFGAFGWSGEAVRNIESRLGQIKAEVYRPGLRIKFNPKDSQTKLDKARIFGEQFAKKTLTLIENSSSEWAQVKTGKWKCLVCGEIFEGEYPPEDCPACGAPADQFVEIKEENITFKCDKETNIVIVGGGIAAISAIESIRKRNPCANIKLISEEEELPYYRILLSKKLCTGDTCSLKDENWFRNNNVELMLGKKVFKTLPEENKIILQDATSVNYDKLIIATGARATKREVYGDDKEGVFWLRNKKDFDRINSFAQLDHVNRIVIVGGGILGIEIACSLREIGKEVTVIEYGPRLMPRQLDRHGAILIQKHLEKVGIKFLTSETIEEIYGTGENFRNVCGVKLAHDGSKLDCQMVIQSTGINPNKEIALGTSIETHRGIIVDKQMKTSIINIFACGDVAEFEGKNIGLWAIALEQGKVAGANAIGDSISYSFQPIATSFKGCDIQFFSIGDIGFEHQERMYQILELSDPEMEVYRKFYFLDNQFVGGILLGDTKKAIHLRKALDKGSSLQTFLDAHFLDE